MQRSITRATADQLWEPHRQEFGFISTGTILTFDILVTAGQVTCGLVYGPFAAAQTF
jgi:hypothetical protein